MTPNVISIPERVYSAPDFPSVFFFASKPPEFYKYFFFLRYFD